MAVCSAGAGSSSKGRKFPRSFVQIVPKTFRRTIIPSERTECQSGSAPAVLTMASSPSRPSNSWHPNLSKMIIGS